MLEALDVEEMPIPARKDWICIEHDFNTRW